MLGGPSLAFGSGGPRRGLVWVVGAGVARAGCASGEPFVALKITTFKSSRLTATVSGNP